MSNFLKYLYKLQNVFVLIAKCICTNCKHKWRLPTTHLKDRGMLMAALASNQTMKSLSNCQIVNSKSQLCFLENLNNSLSRGINPNFWSPIQFQRSQNDLKPRWWKARQSNMKLNLNSWLSIETCTNSVTKMNYTNAQL